ncbi:ABC transporter permease [Lachnoclostridium sp.]|nr:ABC transporter permease [Lachnoclostridium sp.]
MNEMQQNKNSNLGTNFRGWNSVYSFTFRQATKGVGFKVVTALVALLIIAGLILVNVLVAKPKNEDEVKPSNITSVYVLDQSGIATANYDSLMKQFSPLIFGNTKFIIMETGERTEAIQSASNDSATSIAVNITKNEDGYLIEGLIPESSAITESDSTKLLESMKQCFETNKLMQAGLSVTQLTTALKPMNPVITEVGEDNNPATFIIKMIAPMVFGLLLYFMLLLHGQTISKEVSTEKTSKLMETLLTSIHPYAMITGKVLAISSIAILQFLTWVISVFIGLYGGTAVAHAIYPEYENSVITIINFLKDNVGESAFSLPAVIIAILVFCVGFLFYCVLAGLAGCMVTRPEDAASTQGVFVFPILISWLVCYFSAAAGNEGVLRIARYIPFTAPFCVPVDLITGTIGIAQGIVAFLLLAIFSVLVIMMAARIYRGLVLYNGQKLNLKTMFQVLKAKQ